MSKALITGGLGFIGLHLAERLLRDGHRIRVMDNLASQIHGAIPNMFGIPVLGHKKIEVFRGDVRSRQDWEEALEDIGCVVHLAAETGTAQSMYEIERYTATNVLGTAILMDILANEKHGVRKVILASSRSVYGEGAYDCSECGVVYPGSRAEAQLLSGKWDPPCPLCGGQARSRPTMEDSKTQPASIYAAGKLAQEDLVRIAGQALGIGNIVFRFQNVYGEGQSLKNPYTGILSIFSNRIRQGLPIHLFEDGEESRDFVHVSDVAEAVTLAVQSSGGDGHTLNVGYGETTSVRAIAESLKKHFHDDSAPIVSGEYRIGDIRHCYADLSRIRACLGFVPRIGIDEGLRRFVSWVKAQPVEADQLRTANQQLIDRGLMAQAVK